MHLQDVDTTLKIWKLDRYTTVETARTKQCRIQGIRLVRRCQDDDGLRAVEAVHLRQELVQGLLTLIIATHRTVATLLTDGIDLIDEDDTWRLFLRLLEQVTYLRRTHTDEHLDELGAGDGEERNVRLTGYSLRKQGLTGSRRADEQRALRDMCTDLCILIRLLQVVDHLRQKLLRFILTGDVLKGHLVSILRFVLTGIRLSEAAHTTEAAARTERARHALAEPVAERPEQKNRENPGQKEIQQRAGLHRDRLIEVDALPEELLQYLCLGVLVLQSAGLAGEILPVYRRDIGDGIITQIHLRDGLVVHGVHELRIARLTDRSCQQRREYEGIQQQDDEKRNEIIENQRFFILRLIAVISVVPSISTIRAVLTVRELVKEIIEITETMIVLRMVLVVVSICEIHLPLQAMPLEDLYYISHKIHPFM